MKKNPINYILLFLLPLCCLACNQWEGETVESAYREPTIPDPVYQFKRYLLHCVTPWTISITAI